MLGPTNLQEEYENHMNRVATNGTKPMNGMSQKPQYYPYTTGAWGPQHNITPTNPMGIPPLNQTAHNPVMGMFPNYPPANMTPNPTYYSLFAQRPENQYSQLNHIQSSATGFSQK